MKPTVYSVPVRSTRPAGWRCRACAVLAVAGLVACGPGEAPGPARDDQQFQVVEVLPPYEPIPEGGAEARLVEKLRTGSKDALRFAKEALGERGESVVDALVAGLAGELERGTTAATNFLSALVYTRTKRPLPILAEVLERHPLPLVRSQALDSIGRLRQTGLEEQVLAFAREESEAGPRSRLLPTLASLGGDASVAYLEEKVSLWLAEGEREPAGPAAWDNLLTVDSPAARAAIERLLDRVPPPLRVEGITRLIHLGDHDRAAEVRGFLDPTAYAAAGVRHKAVEGLAIAGDFAALLDAREDPDLRVRLAVIDALCLPPAVASDLGREFLEQAARGDDEDMARAALRALDLRGDRTALEPWLALVKGYPTQPGSLGATRMFLRADVGHPALVSILISRWPYADGDQRIDLGRVLAQHADEQAVAFLLERVLDEDEATDVRLYTITSLGNCGPLAIDALLRIWEEQPSPEASERLLNGLLRTPEEPRVAAFLRQVATDPASPDHARAHVLASLPKAYGEGAYAILMEARERAERDVVKRFLDELLHEYF